MLTTLPSPSAQTIRQSVPDQEDIIRRSLERSARYGVDPHLDGAPESTRLSDEQLRERINGQRVFYTLAKEQIDSLYRLLRDTGFCMALADSEGYVLYVVGDSDLVEHFKRRRCIPGYRWTERDIGTCAIGLSLEERVPVFLPGDRMYSAQARKISNAGAPVFSLDGGRVLGAISLSGGSDMMHIHTLGLVRQAAETVTSQLRERERIRELAIKNQYMRALVESDSRGIVTVDQTGRIVEANSTARKLLKLSPGCEGKSFEESVGESYNITGYLKEGKGFRAREILARRSGTTHFASLDPIRMNSGELVGGLFTVMEKKEMMRMAVEMTGAHAHFTFESILGASESLRSALHLAHIAAGSTAPVLLSGETGTGKELFAQAIHNDGPRDQRDDRFRVALSEFPEDMGQRLDGLDIAAHVRFDGVGVLARHFSELRFGLFLNVLLRPAEIEEEYHGEQGGRHDAVQSIGTQSPQFSLVHNVSSDEVCSPAMNNNAC